MGKPTETRFGDAERRREARVPAEFTLRYYFFHAAERPDTKQYRSGKTLDLGPYGIRFEASVMDPAVLPLALEGDVLVDLIIQPPGRPEFRAKGRIVWSWPVDEAENRYMLGVQYVEAQPESRAGLWAHIRDTVRL